MLLKKLLLGRTSPGVLIQVNLLVRRGEDLPADEAIAKLQPAGKPDGGKAEGVTAGTNQRDQEEVQKEKHKAK